ncbi:MAG: precorrin-2 C(20)-methyltransferase [Nitrospinae bacterium]|nr:precorrin-2 C(20)-methyltransferase [Nitrospinota bacterium]
MTVKLGVLYGIGVGPGDPELITVKGARLLSNCRHLFVPKARIKAESVALDIVKSYVNGNAKIHELVFPMVTDKKVLSEKWEESAKAIAGALATGADACFVTLGDSLLYSTYIYLLRELKKTLPGVKIVTVPGVTAFSAVAAITNFPLGEGKEPLTVVPASDDLSAVENALKGEGTVILMKVGKRLPGILALLDKENLLDDAVFVANAGMKNERVETDLRRLFSESPETGYLSTILVHKGRGF